MQSNNVVMFPRPYNGPVVNESPSMEEINQNTDMMKHFHIQETITNIVPMIFNQLDIAGFELLEEDEAGSQNNLKEGAFIVEGLRAIMCRHYGLYHPFQDVWENVFRPEIISGEAALKIVDKLDIEFKKKDN
jgi:hypothetical protein